MSYRFFSVLFFYKQNKLNSIVDIDTILDLWKDTSLTLEVVDGYPSIKGYSGVYTEVTSTELLSIDTWYFISATMDGNSTSIMVNDIETVGVALPTLSDLDRTNSIGAHDATVYNNFFDGDIKNLRVYNKALSAEQINVIYNEGS